MILALYAVTTIAVAIIVVIAAYLIRAAFDAADDIPDWDREMDHCGWVQTPDDLPDQCSNDQRLPVACPIFNEGE